ncbi:hypothetical protein IGI42_000341 [Enterococcus sp. AZ109]
MRYRDGRKSTNVENRTGNRRSGGLAVGGGIGGIIIVLLMLFLGGGNVDVTDILNSKMQSTQRVVRINRNIPKSFLAIWRIIGIRSFKTVG